MPVVRCCLDNLVLDAGHDIGEPILDRLHGLGEIDHEVDVDGVDPPLGDELNPVGHGRSRRQHHLLTWRPSCRPFHQGY